MHDPKQFRGPVGSDGRKVLESMNEHHRELAEWALTVIPDIRPKRILDVGCGGGMLISLLSGKYDAEVCGIDVSEESVAMTKEVNYELVENGRCSVTLGSVSKMPFGDDTFDLVTAFETYFFWPDLENDIKEVARVVAPKGCVLIVSETYPHPKFEERNSKTIEEYGLNIVNNDKMAEMLENAGFQVEIIEIEDNNWVAFLGRKPGS